MRRLWAVLTFPSLVGCGYPEFVFPEAGVDATRPDVADVSVAETMVDSTSVDTGDTAVDDAPDVGTNKCDGGTMCGTTCVDTTSHRQHCGGCGTLCGESETCMLGKCSPLPSCAVLHATFPALKSGAYVIDPDGNPGPIARFETWCEMSEDGGGWTLALKADGNKSTFAYDAPLWTNDVALAPTATVLDLTEAKLASFWTMPFTQLRIGMVEAGVRRFLTLDVAAASLRAAFSGGPISTSRGRAQWFKLVSSPLLQAGCDAEGINRNFITAAIPYSARVRIGILGNNEADCASPDSYIAFGAGFVAPHACLGTDPGVVVGNFAPTSCGPTIEGRATKTFGYVFLR